MQASTAELELLTFLTDENSQARQVAAEHVASFSAQGHPKRFLLTQSPALLKGINGNAKLVGRDGKPCDPVAALKSLCKDQPVSGTLFARVVASCASGGSAHAAPAGLCRSQRTTPFPR